MQLLHSDSLVWRNVQYLEQQLFHAVEIGHNADAVDLIQNERVSVHARGAHRQSPLHRVGRLVDRWTRTVYKMGSPSYVGNPTVGLKSAWEAILRRHMGGHVLA